MYQVPLITNNSILGYAVDYHKLNNRILTARQIKVDGRLGKVGANYPLPTIDNLLACFKDCKYFSTIDLHSGYYHIKLTPEAAEKMAFIIDKGQMELSFTSFWHQLRSKCLFICIR